MVIRDVTLGEKLVFGGLLPRVRVPLWFNRLDRNVVLLGPLSFIGTDRGAISYRDVCNNEGVASGYGGDGLLRNGTDVAQGKRSYQSNF